MTEQISDREYLRILASAPIGDRELQGANPTGTETLFQPEAIDAAKRASKRWLPHGKKPVSGHAVKEREAAFYANQIDLEDAVEAAGGQRGAAKAA